jgi:hypothetical protein
MFKELKTAAPKWNLSLLFRLRKEYRPSNVYIKDCSKSPLDKALRE